MGFYKRREFHKHSESDESRGGVKRSAQDLGVEDKSEKHGKNGHLVGLDIEQRAQGVPPSLPSADFSSNRGNSSTEPLTHCTSISRSR
jgi:hypothetical protein